MAGDFFSAVKNVQYDASACAEMGLSMSAAFTIFAKKWDVNVGYLLRSLQIPFTLKAISVI